MKCRICKHAITAGIYGDKSICVSCNQYRVKMESEVRKARNDVSYLEDSIVKLLRQIGDVPNTDDFIDGRSFTCEKSTKPTKFHAWNTTTKYWQTGVLVEIEVCDFCGMHQRTELTIDVKKIEISHCDLNHKIEKK